MKSTNKFLIVVLVGIVGLVAITIALVLSSPEATYMPEDNPEGVVNNYILAVHDEDYARAYKYLSPNLKGYPPNLNEFKRDVTRYTWRWQRDDSISIDESKISGNTAIVKVSLIRFYEGDLFSSGQSIRDMGVDLVLIGGDWKVTDAGSYFYYCWHDREAYGCN